MNHQPAPGALVTVAGWAQIAFVVDGPAPETGRVDVHFAEGGGRLSGSPLLADIELAPTRRTREDKGMRHHEYVVEQVRRFTVRLPDGLSDKQLAKAAQDAVTYEHSGVAVEVLSQKIVNITTVSEV